MLHGLNKWFNKRTFADDPSPLDRGLGFTIRFAYPDDEVPLRRLAAYDSQRPLTGRVLVAEVTGEIWAAVSIGGDRRAVADPFRSTAALVSLLRHHAAGVPASRTHIPVREAGRPAALAAG